MKTKVCKVCGEEIAKSAKTCPYCGAKSGGFGDKLIECKTCGGEIAQSASICPHCGARQHRAAYAICGVLLAISFFFLVLAVLAIFNGENSNTEAAQNISDTEYISISAVDLWGAYSENAVNADSTYKNEYLAVTGTIIDIGQDLATKAPCISLDTANGGICLYPIQCFFPKNGDQEEQIASLSDGDVITIYGKCSGVPLAQVQLTGCRL